MTNDQFSMHWNGQSYNARFDGNKYPVHGDPANTMVSVKRLNDRTVEETNHRQGRVTNEVRLAAAGDGKTIEVTDNDVVHHQITTYTLDKQE
jgi:molecular chaperone DnaK (HSP70)